MASKPRRRPAADPLPFDPPLPPQVMLAVATHEGVTALVTGQEAAGAARLAGRTDRLPKDVKGITREQLVTLGFVFTGERDELFEVVNLPAGWKIERTGHNLYTKLVDEHGRERATIFYKAAFYDRSAHVTFLRRYGLAWTDKRAADGRSCLYGVEDRGNALTDTPTGTAEEIEAWLAERFPQWQDVMAYWDVADGQ